MRRLLLSTTILSSLLWFTPVQADPVSIAVATAASVGTAAAVAGTVSIITTSLVLTHLAINVAMAFVQKSLQPSVPNVGGLGNMSGQAGYAVSGVSPVADHAIIYGQTRVGGVIVFKEVTDNNKFLHSVIALAGHECQSVDTIFFNDEALTLDGNGNVTAPTKYVSKARVEIALGTDTQSANANLITESNGKWTSDHRLQGICYIYVRLEFDADAYPNGEPQITALVSGKKVFNPNTNSTAFSSNSALCLRDYLTSSYGLGAESSEIDDTKFIAAANVCDENVSLSAGGTQKRYTTNGTFTTSSKPKDGIDQLLRCMGGTLWYAQGKWRVKAAAYVTAALSFSESDLLAGLNIVTRHSRRDNYNVVKGTFKGSETNHQPSDFPQIKSQTFIDADGGIESAIDLDLGMTDTSTMAQRIAKIALFRNREQIVVEGAFSIKAMQAQIGDIIQLTNSRLGFTNKQFEVQNWQFNLDQTNGFVVNMTLQEISSSVYDWNAEETAFESNNTNLADPFDIPPIGLAISSEARVINEHLTNVIIATITADAPERIDNVEVQFKKSSDSNFISAGTGDLGEFEVLDVQDSQYDVRARAINTFGLKGDFVTRSNITVEGLADPPEDVTNFSFNVSSAGIHLEWVPVSDLDLSFYRIRHAQAESGATFANATTSVNKVARPANSVTVPPRSGTYLIKAFDKSGNQSQGATSVVIRAADLDVFSNTLTQTESTGFSGSKTGCSVVSNRLRITDPSSQPSTATYDFSAYIDTGSVRVARVNMEMTVVRINDAATDTFDTLTGNFDALAGLFDDLTGGSSFSDNDVIQFVSTTDDNPAGSPTWSAYKRFKSGDFSGRAFRFRIQLESTADDITPALSALAAKVRYN
jgi:hypothetical protein